MQLSPLEEEIVQLEIELSNTPDSDNTTKQNAIKSKQDEILALKANLIKDQELLHQKQTDLGLLVEPKKIPLRIYPYSEVKELFKDENAIRTTAIKAFAKFPIGGICNGQLLEEIITIPK